jgi:hypothetical protein
MEMTGKIEDFDNQHQSCEQTWAEPTADPSLPEIDRAFWWLENGERGLSSETMWHCFMNRKSFPVNHPHDAGDFSRCYKLLQAVPEWKHDLGKLKELSPAWSNLVDHWDQLTTMYEQNVQEEWKNAEKIGMYQLMKKLTDE